MQKKTFHFYRLTSSSQFYVWQFNWKAEEGSKRFCGHLTDEGNEIEIGERERERREEREKKGETDITIESVCILCGGEGVVG